MNEGRGRWQRVSINNEQGRRHKPDYWLLTLTSLLAAFGLIVVYSISPALAASQHISQGYFITKQIVDVLLGIVAFFIAASLPLRTWRNLLQPLVLITLLGCLVVLVMPVNSEYPAHRWLRLGGFSFQVAE